MTDPPRSRISHFLNCLIGAPRAVGQDELPFRDPGFKLLHGKCEGGDIAEAAIKHQDTLEPGIGDSFPDIKDGIDQYLWPQADRARPFLHT